MALVHLGQLFCDLIGQMFCAYVLDAILMCVFSFSCNLIVPSSVNLLLSTEEGCYNLLSTTVAKLLHILGGNLVVCCRCKICFYSFQESGHRHSSSRMC